MGNGNKRDDRPIAVSICLIKSGVDRSSSSETSKVLFKTEKFLIQLVITSIKLSIPINER